MTPADAVVVVLAGLLAGGVNAAAGGGTLASYPALLAVGLPPVAANIHSSIGLFPGHAGTASAYVPELRRLWPRLRPLLPTTVLGGLGGALLLLTTPEDLFAAMVPAFVASACLLLAVQPRVTRWLEARPGSRLHGAPVRHLAIGACAVYGSYFGAGLGVVLLAVLALLLPVTLQEANALKVALAFTANLSGVVWFVLTTEVDWVVAGVLAVAAVVGGVVGGRFARRLPDRVLRGVVVVGGLGVAVGLLLA